jgi:glycosyltransferase involved in cell wall biosynthesis
MRIAQVVASYAPQIGGVETHVQRLAQGSVEAGDRVTVLTHGVRGYPADEWVNGVRILRFPMTISSRNYPISLGLFRYLRLHATDFDLVHAHNYHTLAGQAAIRSRLPFVFTPHYHGTGHTWFASFLHTLYRQAGARLFARADAIVCVSDAERDLVAGKFPAAAAKIVIIPNGIDPKQGLVDEDRVMPGTPLVLTVGRLERYKNVDLVIEAFRALPTSATLVVVGDGPDRARLEKRAGDSAGWPVRFAGRISEPMLGQLFAQADVVTSASDHEAFGLTLAEGLASGARVVASAIPAHAALGRLAGTGTALSLVDPRDISRFTDLLAESLLAGRPQVGGLKLPTWGEAVKQTRELCSQVLLQGPKAK